MRLFAKVIGAAFGAFALAAAASAAGQPQPSLTKDFGDWTVQCYQNNGLQRCEMIEILINKKTSRRVLGISVLYIPSQQRSVIQVGVPLAVALQSGAVISTDTYTSTTLPYRLCDQQGCYIVLIADDSVVKSLSAASKAKVQVSSLNGKKLDLTFSLNGFASGLQNLMQLSHDTGAAPAPSGEGK